MKSFALLRTNPGLTTNIKVMVDSEYGLSLDSIESVQELATSKLKKATFNKKNYFDELVPYFFRGMPTEISYAIKYEDDADSMTDNFASQYDEIYQYGARNIVSNKDYSEEYEYFAPLHISKGKLPKAFVIFRVDGPGMIKLDRDNIRQEVFEEFKTVKIFDLTKSTPLGEWLDLNFVENKYFPTSPFEMNFEKLEFSQWNGIDYDSGGYTTKSLFMDDFIEEEKEIFAFEKFVFDGFKNNKIVYPNIINFSFLFDDTPATPNGLRKWSINRYFGFYIDRMDQVRTMSPYRVPFLKPDVQVQSGNILSSPSGDPFMEGWSSDRPFYVEYEGEYYKVEKFRETLKATLKPIISKAQRPSTPSMKSRSKEAPIAIPVDRLSGPIEESTSSSGIGSGVVIKEEISPTFADRWRIVANIDLSGKQALLNKNIGTIDSQNILMNYDNTPLEIEGFELADVWLIEIDGRYHNLIKESGKIKIYSDYAFKFYENYYEYWINKPAASYTKRAEFVDANGFPSKFKIYRICFTDIKDFDDRIVDTEFSKFEYEKADDLTETEETKLYVNNLNSNSHPKDVDDFIYKNKVAYIPTSSEYTANHETFKVIGNELTPLWRKNPVYCRWAFEDSLSANDYPYVLNNSVRFEDYNRSVNPFDPDPSRRERNLDYFYTINASTFSYLHHTLHVENNTDNGMSKFYFDFEKYLEKDTYQIGTQSYRYNFDYFTWFFDRKTTFLSGKIKKNVKKHSVFSKGEPGVPNITLFRGIKFMISDIESVSKNSAGQVTSINVKERNSFEDYKFSILLSHINNGMIWDVVDEWKMGKKYKKGEIVSYADVLYRARRDNSTIVPVISRNSIQIKAVPYNLEADWEYYINDSIPLFSPMKAENRYYSKNSAILSKSIVYNSGDYYIFNGYDKPIDFWNPMIAYRPNSRLLIDTNGRIGAMGYSKGAIVLYRGDYYRSLSDNNIYPPNFTQETYENDSWRMHWVKVIGMDSKLTRWSEINIWNPSLSYDPKTYIVHGGVLYQTGESKAPSGEMPGRSALWKRMYSFEPDTDYIYQPNSNPLIRMNNEYYLMVSNQWSKSMENGIRIYINKRWKNILVNIAINDNTATGLSGKDRDFLYTSLNKKLTAMNFIECVNNLSNKGGFTDYVKYIVVSEDGSSKEYDYSNIESLPHILFAEKPQQIEVKVESLKVGKRKVSSLKPSKVLEDGKINDIKEINYFNKTHIATTIEENKEEPSVGKMYHGGASVTTDSMFRFSGNYYPLFGDISLFKRDNSTEYNEMQIALNLESTQELVFRFERDGQSVTKLHKIYSGGSYSVVASPLFTVSRMDPERPPIPLTSIGMNRQIPVIERRNDPPAIPSLADGNRYIVGSSATGDWMGTFSSGQNAPSKSGAIAEWSIGYFNPLTGLIVATGSTSSLPDWTPSTPLVATWSYYSPSLRDIVWNESISSDMVFSGIGWSVSKKTYTEEERFYRRNSASSTFVKADFYDQIKNIILGEGLFSGIEFIFETHHQGSQYIHPELGEDYAKYDRIQAEEEGIRNYNILSVKYKSSYGNIKLDIERQKPSIQMDIIDAGVPGSNLIITLGATGINPPFMWSIGMTPSHSYYAGEFEPGEYSSTNSYIAEDESGTEWIFDVTVMDSSGLTSSIGYYSVNSGNTYSFAGTFSYTSL